MSGEQIEGVVELTNPPPRRTGVIVAVDRDITVESAVRIREELTIRFPEVTFAVVPARTSIAFEWDQPEETP